MAEHVLKRLNRATGGTAATEFAFIAPVLIIMILGVVDFGGAIRDNMKLKTAAKAGAHYALVKSLDLNAIMAVAVAATDLDPAQFTVTASSTCGCLDGSTVACNAPCADGSTRRTYVTVGASKSHDFLFTYPGVDNPMTMTAQTKLRVN